MNSQDNSSTPNFLLEGEETERLVFRKLLISDFEAWIPFYNDARSSQYWEGLPTDPKTACKQQFKRTFSRYENGLGGMNVLVRKTNSELIGMCGLIVQDVDGIRELEIGYSILPKFWQQGFAYEAAQKCLEFAITSQLATSLISIIHVDNIPSQKVAQKIGMKLHSRTTYKNNPVHIYRIAI